MLVLRDDFEGYQRGEELREEDVDRYLVGYPYMIAHEDGGEVTEEEREAARGRLGTATQSAEVGMMNDEAPETEAEGTDGTSPVPTDEPEGAEA